MGSDIVGSVTQKKIDMLENSQSKDHAFALEVSICRTFNRKIMMSFLHTKEEWCLNKKKVYIERYVLAWYCTLVMDQVPETWVSRLEMPLRNEFKAS